MGSDLLLGTDQSIDPPRHRTRGAESRRPCQYSALHAPALFADSVSFSIPHPPGIPWVPEVDSSEGMRTFFESLRTHVQPKEFDLRQVIADGDDVV